MRFSSKRNKTEIIDMLREKKILPIIFGIIFIIIALVFIFEIWRAGIFSMLKSPEKLEAYINNTGGKGMFYLFLFQILCVVFLPFAGAVPAIAGGVLFGFWKSFFICSAGLLIGSCINFALAKYLGRPFVSLFFKRETIDKYLNSFDERKKILLFLMFFFPGFPDTLLCFVAGLTSISWGFFAAAVVLGRPWGLIFSSLIGSGALHISIGGYIIFGILILLVLIFSWKFGASISAFFQRKIMKRFGVIHIKHKK